MSTWLAMGVASDFSKDLALDKGAVLSFVHASQPKEWEKLKQYYRKETENKFIQRLFKELDLRGMLDGFGMELLTADANLNLLISSPIVPLNPDTVDLYKQNRLIVTRQVYFSSKSTKSIDLVLSINGLPLAIIELKNHFTSQAVRDAIDQYKTSRDPKELLFQFKKRALVHFTLDPDDVYFTTKLDSGATRFFPFNKGFNNAAGNPRIKITVPM